MDTTADGLTHLAIAARDGDVVALAAFARATYRDVWRFCAYLDQPGAADDLTQEVYVRAIRALPAFRGECSARTWLIAIARRTVADAVRSRRRRRRFDQRSSATVDSAPDPTGAVDLRQVIAQLDDDQRRAFVMTQVAGLSYAEAAHVCACPVGTIRSRVARARAALLVRMESVLAD